MEFTTAEAKQYLIQAILTEAEREGVSLSEIEQKMLHFTESYPTLPDMKEINQAFEQDYEDVEYEDKIEALVRNIIAGLTVESEARWNEAVGALNEDDHYLAVMINSASRTLPFVTMSLPAVRPPHDRLKLMVTAAVIFGVMMAVIAIVITLRNR